MRKKGLAICIRVPVRVSSSYNEKTKERTIHTFKESKPFGAFRHLRFYRYWTAETGTHMCIDDNKKAMHFRWFDTWFRRIK